MNARLLTFDWNEPLLARAIEIEGEVPVLRALRALGSIMQMRTGASRASALMQSVEDEARALITLAPERPYGYALLGFLGYERGDMVTAVQALRRALELDPSDADVRFFLGISLQAADRPDTRFGLEWVALDPLSPLANILVAANTWFTKSGSDGVAYLEEAVRLVPEGMIFRWGLGYHYALLGRVDEAAKCAEWLSAHAALLPYTAQLGSLVACLQGRTTDAQALLATVDVTSLDGHHTFHLSESYAMAGDVERAMTLATRAVSMGFFPHTYITGMCPFYAPLRDAAGFAQVAATAAERVAQFDAAFAV